MKRAPSRNPASKSIKVLIQIFSILGLVLAVPITPTVADPGDNAADEAATIIHRVCYANFPSIGPRVQGWAHVVRTSSGVTKSKCEFQYPPEITFDSAVTLTGWACRNEGGLTYDTFAHITPNGRGFLTCWSKSP